MTFDSFIDSSSSGANAIEKYRGEIARLPLTMRPALNQQVDGWEDLFPFEQRRTSEFLRGVSLFQPDELDALTHSLREVEAKMDVGHWNFSDSADTMSNASQLARSSYYAEWRREVERVFAAIDKKARESAPTEPSAGRMILLILPDSLPIASITSRKHWDPRGMEFSIDGDVRRVCELALRGPTGLPALLAAQSKSVRDVASTDCWLIDADAALGAYLKSPEPTPANILQYQELKQFRDQFLAQVNTVPKDIEATDQILAGMRKQNWSDWWPASLAGQDRLRSFVINLFLSGNGALIFSNAFVQWTASEALRRARPRLVVARFGLRSKPKPFTSIAIFENQQKISRLRDVDDPEGSAIDALILAQYVWLSARRYPERDNTCCVCVAESSRNAYVIAPDGKRPSWPKDRPIQPEELCEWMRHSLTE